MDIRRLRCMLGRHDNISREIHIREKHLKTFEETNIKHTCHDCGKRWYIPGLDTLTSIIVWTSNQKAEDTEEHF